MDLRSSVVPVFLIVQLFATTCSGLQCYECTYYKLDSSVGILDTLLNVFDVVSDDHCQLRSNEHHDDQSVIAIRNCPKPKKGNVAKCATLEGTVKTTIRSVSVDYKTIERSCVEVAEDDPETSNKCHKDLPANGVARSLLSKTLSKVGDISFDGTTCYTQSDVAVPGLQCPRCTWNDVETSNVLLNLFINGLEKLSSDDCKFENLEEDKYTVRLRNCPAPKQGYINKCGTITGKIKAKTSIGLEVRYTTVNRDCIQVPEDATAYEDGCHSDLPANGPIRALILETFAGVNLGDVQFDGEACYDHEADTRVASLQRSGSARSSAAVLLLGTCAVLAAARRLLL